MNENRSIIAGVAAGSHISLAVFFLGKNLVIGLVLGIAAFIIFAVLFRPSGTIKISGYSGGGAGGYPGGWRGGLEGNSNSTWQNFGIPTSKGKRRPSSKTIQDILKELKARPENISAVRKFFKYYLPTLDSILGKYERIEGGVIKPEQKQLVSKYLGAISKKAMDKQYANLFEDDMLDLIGGDGKFMTNACKQGWTPLTEEDFKKSARQDTDP
ncbi:MAG: 5-bromo-4-chloroindolyl phosphate hydrolysis family protein [Clostridia bacterium]